MAIGNEPKPFPQLQTRQMGIDGIQRIYIRGPAQNLDELQARGLRMDDPANPEAEYVGTHQYFFGPDNVDVGHREPNYLACSMIFRNDTIYEQMEMLLNKYPKCWFKNEYETETGNCGMWIGRYRNGKPEIQTLEWKELAIEELHHLHE